MSPVSIYHPGPIYLHSAWSLWGCCLFIANFQTRPDGWQPFIGSHILKWANKTFKMKSTSFYNLFIRVAETNLDYGLRIRKVISKITIRILMFKRSQSETGSTAQKITIRICNTALKSEFRYFWVVEKYWPMVKGCVLRTAMLLDKQMASVFWALSIQFLIYLLQKKINL